MNTEVLDVIFLCGNVAKAGMLLPTLVNTDATVNRSTSVITMVVWTVFAVGYLSMGLQWAFVTGLFGALLWLLIGVYRND